jgi:hypothetical protein
MDAMMNAAKAGGIHAGYRIEVPHSRGGRRFYLLKE